MKIQGLATATIKLLGAQCSEIYYTRIRPLSSKRQIEERPSGRIMIQFHDSSSSPCTFRKIILDMLLGPSRDKTLGHWIQSDCMSATAYYELHSVRFTKLQSCVVPGIISFSRGRKKTLLKAMVKECGKTVLWGEKCTCTFSAYELWGQSWKGSFKLACPQRAQGWFLG